MIRRYIKGCFRRLGYDLSVRKTPAPLNADGREFTQFLETVSAQTMVPREGLFSLYQKVIFCEENSIDGAFVECGVWKGGAVALMALTNLRHGRSRREIHLFDSFEEICEPDETVDGARALMEAKTLSRSGGTKGRLVPLKGIYDHRGGPGTIGECERLLVSTVGYTRGKIHFHKGWFQDTVPAQSPSIGKIAILRLDGDWYASTKVCLDHLFRKVVSGGFVIIDDYGAYDGCRKAVDEFIDSFDRPLFLNYVNRDIRYIIMP